MFGVAAINANGHESTVTAYVPAPRAEITTRPRVSDFRLMTLNPGAKLGPYEISAPIGAGGMGEVFRARDTKLDREVALKVLPPAFAQDPERVGRGSSVRRRSSPP